MRHTGRLTGHDKRVVRKRGYEFIDGSRLGVPISEREVAALCGVDPEWVHWAVATGCQGSHRASLSLNTTLSGCEDGQICRLCVRMGRKARLHSPPSQVNAGL